MKGLVVHMTLKVLASFLSARKAKWQCLHVPEECLLVWRCIQCTIYCTHSCNYCDQGDLHNYMSEVQCKMAGTMVMYEAQIVWRFVAKTALCLQRNIVTMQQFYSSYLLHPCLCDALL